MHNAHINLYLRTLYVSDSYPAFFLLIATTSNKKIFKSAETVNVKFGVYEFGDKGQ